MRTFYDGNGVDSTAAVQEYLATHDKIEAADLYVIKVRRNFAQVAFQLTDYPTPLKYGYRTFKPAVISRDGVESSIGLESKSMSIGWSPKDTDGVIFADDGSILLNVPQAFRYGMFDSGVCEVWRAIMPSPGDCYTLGACKLFGGIIGESDPQRNRVDFTVDSRLIYLNTQVPTNVIEPTNILAEYSVGANPCDLASPVKFEVLAGSTASKIIADVSGSAPGYTASNGLFNAGYLVMAEPAKLQGFYRTIRKQILENGHHSFYFYEPLPFAPTVGDTFTPYVPVPRDLNGVSGAVSGAGFPYVPQPEQGI